MNTRTTTLPLGVQWKVGDVITSATGRVRITKVLFEATTALNRGAGTRITYTYVPVR